MRYSYSKETIKRRAAGLFKDAKVDTTNVEDFRPVGDFRQQDAIRRRKAIAVRKNPPKGPYF